MYVYMGFPNGSEGKESACNVGDAGSTWDRPRNLLFQEDPLEKGMITHSSILVAWRILWTEEPGGLQSMGSQRVGPD